MTIGQVASRSGVAASAIRYYERAGLLPKPTRSSGQRRYNDQILERLALVDFAKQCGFTLSEIRQLFHGFRDDTPLSVRMQGLARKKVAELDSLARRIEIMKAMLERAQRCNCIDIQECGRRILQGSAGQQGFYRRVVAEGLTGLRVAVHVARAEHETSTELERILSQLLLAKATGLRALTSDGVVGAQQMENVGRLQADRAVRLAVFVDQQRKLDAGLFAKRRSVKRIAHPDGRQLGTARFEFCMLLAQLRDVLAAEESSVVAQEHNYGRR